METIILKTQHFLIIFTTFYNDLYPGGFYVWLFLFGCCCGSVAKLYLTLCNPMDCSMPGSPVLHCLLEFAQIHVHWVDDAIQPTHALLPSSFAFNLSKHQGLFKWISSSHQVARGVGASTPASVFPMNIQDWFPLRWTGWILNSSTGIPSPPLALFVVMLPWLPNPGSLALGEWSYRRGYLGRNVTFLYSSSMYSCHLFLISSASVRSIPFLSFIVPSLHEMFPWYL